MLETGFLLKVEGEKFMRPREGIFLKTLFSLKRYLSKLFDTYFSKVRLCESKGRGYQRFMKSRAKEEGKRIAKDILYFIYGINTETWIWWEYISGRVFTKIVVKILQKEQIHLNTKKTYTAVSLWWFWITDEVARCPKRLFCNHCILFHFCVVDDAEEWGLCVVEWQQFTIYNLQFTIYNDEDGYKSEVCVWLSDDKKISQSLQQKQHQSEQDEDDSLF